MNWYNPYIVIPLTAWFIAQLTKFLINARNGKVDLRFFYASGGMPSAHSAAISALAVTALVHEGITSPIFGLAAVFAAVVIYDSFGVRRAAGDQAVAINAIIDSFNERRDLRDIQLREVLGHRPTEVIVGMVIGISLALLLSISIWIDKAEFLLDPATPAQKILLLALAIVLLVKVLLNQWLLGKKRLVQTKSVVQLRRFNSWSLAIFAAVGLFLSLAQYQEIPNLDVLGWWCMLIAVILIYYGLAYLLWIRLLPARYRAEKEQKLVRQSSRRKRH